MHDEETNLLIPPELRTAPADWDIFGDASRIEDLLGPLDMGPVGGPATESLGPLTVSVPTRHRKRRQRVQWLGPSAQVKWLRWTSLLIAAAATVLMAMLSVLGGLISYGPLRDAAAPGASEALTDWWPLLIYGPWLVASLSIVRAALHQRRSLHSWVVVVLFSGIAVALCVAQAAPTVMNVAVAGLPPVSALLAFHQIVRQITLISPPRHAVPRQRSRAEGD
ncbi:DUF2637 domain-containing protein [Streptomyces avicenniae]|uniref:DUF2637 domain-containing protein n=1 Tax=Streptomyces avicenniae TaxID=500153 RepID=UPI001CBA63AD|nr:DUF2637 domain-containing protein [Streptomyces avicenniae]